MHSQRLTLELRDLNAELVDAWARHFAGCPGVVVSAGEIFDARADAIVSPANSFGFMDGGIDLIYLRRFGGELQDRLQELLRSEHHGELPVGDAAVISTGDSAIFWMVSAPTMRIPGPVADTPNAYLAFRAALRAVLKHNASGAHQPIRSVLCPGLATAIGRMPVERCARQMRLAWGVVLGGEAWPPPSPGMIIDGHYALLR